MSTIICIHGIGQQVEGEDSLLAHWIPALRDGIGGAGGERPDPDVVAMAFYGDLFRKKVTMAFYADVFAPEGMMAIGVPPYDESDITEKWEKEMLKTWWEEAARIDETVPGPAAQTKLRTPRLVQRALNALSQSKFFAEVALNFFIADLKQVHAYLTNDAVRERVQERVERAVTEETRVVVAHSLGTIVAYEALCRHPEWPVRTLITLGSPLGIKNLIFERLRPAPDDGMGTWPEGILHWSNIADRGDIVALVKELRPQFGDRVRDQLVHNGAKAHDALPYLTAHETGHAILQGLAE